MAGVVLVAGDGCCTVWQCEVHVGEIEEQYAGAHVVGSIDVCTSFYQCRYNLGITLKDCIDKGSISILHAAW